MERTPEQLAVQGGAAVPPIKRPAFQFYPADWRKDAALQSCSIAAQGLWINMMCVAHQCEPYGHLAINKKPMNGAQIGRLVGLSAKECDKLIAELEDAGVVSRTDEGVLFSRRMVRDERVRNSRGNGGMGGKEYGALGAEHGKKGGRPPKARPVNNPPSDDERGVIYPPLEPPPSSSSSSSSSNTTHTMPDQRAGEPDGSVCVLVCQKMQEVGVGDTNAGDGTLALLVGRGAGVEAFVEAARLAVGKGKGFGYAVGIVKNKMAEAAAAASVALAAPAAAPAGRVDVSRVTVPAAPNADAALRQLQADAAIPRSGPPPEVLALRARVKGQAVAPVSAGVAAAGAEV